MKRIKQLIFILILGLLVNPLFQLVEAADEVDVHFFHSTTCLNCGDMDEFLIKLEENYPEMNIIYYEIKL